MKKQILLAAFLLPLAAFAQKSITITGKVGIKTAPTMVYMIYDNNTWKDSVIVKNGEFAFKNVQNPKSMGDPWDMTLIMRHKGDGHTPAHKLKDYKRLYVEQKDLKIISSDSLKYAKIIGSKTNLELDELNALTKRNTDSITRILAPITTYMAKQPPMEMEQLYKLRDQPWMKPIYARAEPFQKKVEALTNNFYKTHPQYYLALTIFTSKMLFHQIPDDSVRIQFDHFSPAMKATALGKSITESLRKQDEGLLKMGTAPPAFTHADINGKQVSLASFKGKYILIDFWASWCVPCRAENPNVLKAYKALHDKGLEIVSISTDNSLEAWKAAVTKDDLPWTQVCDKNAKEGIAISYNISSIPMNFLIDPEGKLIGQNLRGEDVDKKIAKLMKVD